MKPKQTERVQIQVVSSFLAGGHYAEVWEADTGNEVLTTEVYGTEGEALTAAREWAAEKGYGVE